jgi:hypothetical protein
MEPVAQFVRSKFKATSMLEARVVERFAEAICDAERVKLELKVLDVDGLELGVYGARVEEMDSK